MKNIIIGAVAAAIATGTLIAAPPALADEPGRVRDLISDPTREVTRDVTTDVARPGPFAFPVEFPRLMDEPTYGSGGVSHQVREVRSVHSAYSIPPSNPTA